MSTRYPGGVITKTPVVPTGPYEDGAAPGIWTLDQQLQAAKSGIWPTAGNIDPGKFIENIFSTYLYTGNDAALTVTNGIDLSGEGGLVWGKSRSGVQNHRLYDTARGSSFSLISNASSAQSNQGANACAFNADGFSLSAASGIVGSAGFGGPNYVSWTFRKQPKFFDIVTYTGTGAVQNIAHNLGSVPGCIIVKKTNDSSSWITYHRGLNGGTNPSQYFVALNLTNAEAASSNPWNNTAPTSAVFTAGLTNSEIGITYVAYLFAHDAGGFGLTGTDNVISCGSYAGSSVAQDINLGYEAQWVLVKNITTSGWDWYIIDNMRGFVVTPAAPNFTKSLSPNTSGAEGDQTTPSPSSTGFRLTEGGVGAFNQSGQTYVYIAIRRGPMQVPTVGTSVFALDSTITAANKTITTGFPSDSSLATFTSSGLGVGRYFWDRLRGSTTSSGVYLRVTSTNGETTSGFGWGFDKNTSVVDNFFFDNFGSNYNTIYYNFRRAPTYFDEVCYTGNGVVGQTYTHNLAAVPQLLIVKRRDTTGAWITLYQPSMLSADLGSTAAFSSGSVKYQFGNDVVGISPTTTQFTVSPNGGTNTSAATYIAYLFATCAGVSKVGSYTGTGALQTVDCGFTSGARFVLIKRRDSTGDWYVWDSARGITGGDDPYLLLNTTADETTGTNYVDTVASGFKVTAAAPAAINANGGTYIFLAIA